MQMDIGLDTGDMLLKSECDITPDDTSASLHDKLMALGSVALLETLEQIQSGSLKPQKQDDSLANYAEKISKEEAKIDWGESVETIERKIRAYNPFPVAYTFVGDKRIKVCQAEIIANDVSDSIPGKIIAFNEEGIAVACGKGLLLIQSLQIPGKKPMQAKDLLNGYSDTFGADGHFE